MNDVVVEIMEGDARNVLCETVEKHHASVLVVGSHGYGAIKRCFPYLLSLSNLLTLVSISYSTPSSFISLLLD